MPSSRQNSNIHVNLVLFQSVWFLTVIAAANGSWWPGLAGLGVFIAVHCFVSPTARADFLLVICALLIGLVCETIFIRTGMLVYSVPGISEAGSSIAGVPVWILVLWANFALIMNGCLAWLRGRYVLAAVLGFAGAPLSYFGGIKLGAALPGESLFIAMLAIASCYAVITPLLIFLAQWLSKTRPA